LCQHERNGQARGVNCGNCGGLKFEASGKRTAQRKSHLMAYRTINRKTAKPATLQRLFQLLYLSANPRLLERRQIFDKHSAHQVIHFMLNANRQQAAAIDLESLAVFIQRAHAEVFRPLHEIVNTGHGKAAFLVNLLFFARPHNFRIDERMKLVVSIRHVDHDHAFVHVDLGRRQADARHRVHRFAHVDDKFADPVVDNVDGLRDLVQPLVRVFKYVEQGHN
jgi:hypothetical protein